MSKGSSIASSERECAGEGSSRPVRTEMTRPVPPGRPLRDACRACRNSAAKRVKKPRSSSPSSTRAAPRRQPEARSASSTLAKLQSSGDPSAAPTMRRRALGGTQSWSTGRSVWGHVCR